MSIIRITDSTGKVHEFKIDEVTIEAVGTIVENLPPVDPPPEPEPEPSDKPIDIARQILGASCLNIRGWWNGTSRYERWQDFVILKTLTAKVVIQKQDLLTGGGGLRAMLASEYQVKVGDVVLGTFSGGTSNQSVSLDLSELADGWHVIDVTTPDTEFFAAFPVFILRGEETPKADWMPVFTSSKEVSGSSGMYRVQWVPAKFQPTLSPLQQREILPIAGKPAKAKLWFEQIVPFRNNRRPNISKEGVLNTCNRQWYTWGDFIAKTPRLPLLDGPRGQGSFGYATHVSIGTGTFDPTPESPLMGNLYVTDPWRLCRIDKYGKITTLVGYRHKSPQSYWDDPQDLELVGDWSAIPVERHGFREIWGFCWKKDTLEIDINFPRIPSEANRHPHFVAPVAFIADSQNNRIVRVEFNARAHDVPPKVTEFITDLNDPWDCVTWGDSLIVSERLSHRICEYDSNTGDLRRVIAHGEPLATVDFNRFVKRLNSLSAIRIEKVVAPEGLYVLDDWLYFASSAMRQVKRIRLVTGEIEIVVASTQSNTIARYLKIAVSDGTFGDKGSVFVTDWTVNRYGAPYAYTPDGIEWGLISSTGTSMPRGAGGDYDSSGYSAAVGVGGGRLVYGGSSEGLVMLTAALPNEIDFNKSKYRAGLNEWYDNGYGLTRGRGGYGFYGLELPWGKTPEIDYYLEVNGHINNQEK